MGGCPSGSSFDCYLKYLFYRVLGCYRVLEGFQVFIWEPENIRVPEELTLFIFSTKIGVSQFFYRLIIKSSLLALTRI